jgi:IclR family transcriptional regulator, mhp operon transcriptional activator
MAESTRITSTVRGLERGLRVLKMVRAKPTSALHEIHAATRLPKPTLLRILRTLEQAGMVRRRLADGRYQIGAEVYRVSRKPDRYDRLAEVAGPVLDRLCRKLEWPSDLAVPGGDHMEIRETSRPLSPFVLNHDQIGHQINWVLSGHGRAYLAFCAERERQSLLDLLQRSGISENRLAFDTAKLNRIFADVRRRGYATRDPTHVGGFYGRPPYSDGLAAIAVPVWWGGQVYGAINLVWLKNAHSVEHIVAHHLADLQAAAAEISAASPRESRKN